jgi:hypothetical protein
MNSIINYSPRHRVKVYDFKTDAEICDMSNDILSISTNKAYRRVFGSFNLTLTYAENSELKKRYDNILKPNQRITIELDAGDGTGLKFVMNGLIDRVGVNASVSMAALNRSVTVSGRDLGKLLSTTELGWDLSGINRQIYPDGVGRIVAATIPRYLNQSGTPAELCEFVYKLFQAQTEGATYPKHIKLLFSGTATDSWVTFFPEMVGVKGSSVWDAMMRVSNHPYNFLTTVVDRSTGEFYIYLDTEPYDSEGKLNDNRPFHTIDPTLVVNEQTGISDDERVNLLCLWPPTYKLVMNGQVEIALAREECTRYDLESINSNGFCTKIIEPIFTPLSFGTSTKAETDITEVVKRRDLFWGWFQKNHTYQSGTFTIHGNPGIQQGDGLIKDDYHTKTQYLIEQVSHQYQIWPMPTYQTSLQVTRGQTVQG